MPSFHWIKTKYQMTKICDMSNRNECVLLYFFFLFLLIRSFFSFVWFSKKSTLLSLSSLFHDSLALHDRFFFSSHFIFILFSQLFLPILFRHRFYNKSFWPNKRHNDSTTVQREMKRKKWKKKKKHTEWRIHTFSTAKS